MFVFYIEDRFFGVITAFVPGKESGNYVFTSSLPVAILKLLAPNIEALWPRQPAAAAPKGLILASNPATPQNSTVPNNAGEIHPLRVGINGGKTKPLDLSIKAERRMQDSQ